MIGKHHRIERVLHEGPRSVIVAALNVGTERSVAIKLLRPEVADDVTRAAFMNEARCTSRVTGKHGVQAFDFGEVEDTLYLVLELLEGVDLATLLARDGGVRPELAIELVRQLCKALGEIHASGVLHGNLVPANLFLTHRDGAPLLRVLDFGAATEALDPAPDVRAAGKIARTLLAGVPLPGKVENAIARWIDADPARPGSTAEVAAELAMLSLDRKLV